MKNCLLFLMAFICFTKMQAQSDTSIIVASPVPVPTFQAQPVDRVIVLKWSLEQSEEYKSFDIERSDDGINFIKIGSKLAISKRSNADYDFVDATPRRNVILRYRIKLISKDGFFSYSDFKETKAADPALTVRLKQNPVRNNVEVELNALSAKQASVTIVSQAGQQITSQTFRLSSGTNQLSLSSQTLLQGLYQLVVEAGSERKIISFIKE